MKWILVLGMNMDTLVRCFSGRNDHNALKSLSNWFKEDTSSHNGRLNVKTQPTLSVLGEKLQLSDEIRKLMATKSPWCIDMFHVSR